MLLRRAFVNTEFSGDEEETLCRTLAAPCEEHFRGGSALLQTDRSLSQSPSQPVEKSLSGLGCTESAPEQLCVAIGPNATPDTQCEQLCQPNIRAYRPEIACMQVV
jgi:hypothetical protein